MKNSIKHVAFDLDGTLTRGMSWHLFHRVAGLDVTIDNSWREMYFSKEISYAEWLKYIETEYRKSRKNKQDFLKSAGHITFLPGAKKLIARLKTRYPLHIVTSSVDIYAERVARILEITALHVNHSFVFDAEEHFSRISYHAPEAEAKVIYLKQVSRDFGLHPSQIAFVGDSLGDLGAFDFTARGILVGSGSDVLKKAAWKQVSSLKEIERILL